MATHTRKSSFRSLQSRLFTFWGDLNPYMRPSPSLFPRGRYLFRMIFEIIPGAAEQPHVLYRYHGHRARVLKRDAQIFRGRSPRHDDDDGGGVVVLYIMDRLGKLSGDRSRGGQVGHENREILRDIIIRLLFAIFS